jgi:hypothetical protein
LVCTEICHDPAASVTLVVIVPLNATFAVSVVHE